jgi:hypothetical protein
MIQNDLKEKLGEDWRSNFAHRDCDQSNYEFGSFEVDGKKINLVLNPDTLDIMDYYYDDFSGWNDLEIIDSRLSGRYFINNKFDLKLKSEKFERIINLPSKDFHTSNRNNYPRLTLFGSNGERIHIQVHRLLALIFIPNPNPELYTIINHKDCNTSNFRLENLEWCNNHINNLKKNQKSMDSKIMYIQCDNFGNEVKTWKYKDREELFNLFPKVLRNIGTEKLYKGYLWKRVDTVTEDYLKNHKIDPSGWFDDNGLHDFGKFKVRANTCGVLEIDGKVTVGCLTERSVYIITINSKKYFVHRVLYEIITGRLLKSDEIIDHIIPSTVESTNNEFSNLRCGSQKDNMNNILTKKSLYKKYSVYDPIGNIITSFNSEKELAEYYDVSNKHMASIVKRIIIWKGLVITSERYSIEYKLSYIYYKYSLDPNSGILEINEYTSNIRKFSNKLNNAITIKKYLNTGMPAPDGYYYQQGDPNNLIMDESNELLIPKRPLLSWDN